MHQRFDLLKGPKKIQAFMLQDYPNGSADIVRVYLNILESRSLDGPASDWPGAAHRDVTWYDVISPVPDSGMLQSQKPSLDRAYTKSPLLCRGPRRGESIGSCFLFRTSPSLAATFHASSLSPLHMARDVFRCSVIVRTTLAKALQTKACALTPSSPPPSSRCTTSRLDWLRRSCQVYFSSYRCFRPKHVLHIRTGPSVRAWGYSL